MIWLDLTWLHLIWLDRKVRIVPAADLNIRTVGCTNASNDRILMLSLSNNLKYSSLSKNTKIPGTSPRKKEDVKVIQYKDFNYISVWLFFCDFIFLCIYTFICLFIYWFIHVFIYFFIHLFTFLFLNDFIDPFICSFIHLLLVYLFIYSFIYLFILFIYVTLCSFFLINLTSICWSIFSL